MIDKFEMVVPSDGYAITISYNGIVMELSTENYSTFIYPEGEIVSMPKISTGDGESGTVDTVLARMPEYMAIMGASWDVLGNYEEVFS